MFRILMIMSIILIMMGFYLKKEEKNKSCSSEAGYSSIEKIVELDRRVRALENFKSN